MELVETNFLWPESFIAIKNVVEYKKITFAPVELLDHLYLQHSAENNKERRKPPRSGRKLKKRPL